MQRLILGILVIALGLAVGATGALAAGHSAGSNVTVKVAGTGLGRILVDGRGHTLYLFEKDNLYLFEKDKRGTSACNGPCSSFWPPLLATFARPLTAGGAKAALLGTTKRDDGRSQVTYNHHPLYTFVKDTKKGQTTGQGVKAFGAEWYVVSPGGLKLEGAATTSGSGGSESTGRYGSAPSSGGSGY
jgi:predicted lipoprotein with Yx(FWY)xxD motif